MWEIIIIIILIALIAGGLSIDWKVAAIAYKENEIGPTRTLTESVQNISTIYQQKLAEDQKKNEILRQEELKKQEEALKKEQDRQRIQAEYEAKQAEERAKLAAQNTGLRIEFSPQGAGSLAAFYGTADQAFLKDRIAYAMSFPWLWKMQEPTHIFNPDKNSPIAVNVKVMFNGTVKFSGILPPNKSMKITRDTGETSVY
jgi:hypothetical protein